MSITRSTIKQFLPPIILSAARLLRRRLRYYPSWEAAKHAAGSYDDDLINRFRVDRDDRKPELGLIDGSALRLLAHLHPTASIVDFGGSTGRTGVAICSEVPSLTYTVVENPALIRLIQPGLSVLFVSELPDSFDIFFTSCTLQYIDAPYEILATAFSRAKMAVILSRNSFSETDLFRVQMSRLFDNGSGPIPAGYSDTFTSYPQRTIRESRVHEIAAEHGFKLAMRSDDIHGTIGRDYGKQLVFLMG